jgi:DNA-binding transcriptional regulator YdaS (Cro superfamily)
MEPIDKAISILGGVSRTAEALGVVQGAVSNWIARKSVPASRCLAIENATNGAVTRYELRPDVFGEPAKTKAA